jgi:DNA mismatch endonuclease Vsr
MAAVHSKDTKPEMVVRRLVHRLGYRFRVHRKDLPGKPDLVFPSRRKAIFVHGCFWHRHKGCRYATVPKTRTDFWQEKFEANVVRDHKSLAALTQAGWSVLIVWQCELKEIGKLAEKIDAFLKDN